MEHPEKFRYPLASDETIERNLKRKEGTAGRCVICNAPCNEKTAWWVHPLTSDYGIIWANDVPDEVTDTDSMGSQPVGPECARKIPLEYRIR